MNIKAQDNKKDSTKKITAVILVVVVLAVAYFVFIQQKRETVYQPPAEVDEKKLLEKFNIDFFDDDVFKNLVDIKDITLEDIKQSEIGRINPFLEFK